MISSDIWLTNITWCRPTKSGNKSCLQSCRCTHCFIKPSIVLADTFFRFQYLLDLGIDHVQLLLNNFFSCSFKVGLTSTAGFLKFLKDCIIVFDMSGYPCENGASDILITIIFLSYLIYKRNIISGKFEITGKLIHRTI